MNHNHNHNHPHALSLAQLPIGMLPGPHGTAIGIGIPIMASTATPVPVPVPMPLHTSYLHQPMPIPVQATQINSPILVSPDSSSSSVVAAEEQLVNQSQSPSNGSNNTMMSQAQWPQHSITQMLPHSHTMGSYQLMGMGIMGPQINEHNSMIYGVHLGTNPGQVHGNNNYQEANSNNNGQVGTNTGHPVHQVSQIVHQPVPVQVSPSVNTTMHPKHNENTSTCSTSATSSYQIKKEILHFKSLTLFPPNPSAPAPTLREKPPGCRTVFVGGLPDNMTENMIVDIFSKHAGEITTVRMSKKNFCHVRFESEDFVESAVGLSGYRVRIGSNSDGSNIGRLHVDYAHARDDQYEYECRQRVKIRGERHREKIEVERLNLGSQEQGVVTVVNYSEHECQLLCEGIKAPETFTRSVQILNTWLERGDINKRNASTFYSMIQSTNAHYRKLLVEKEKYEEEFKKAKELYVKRYVGVRGQVIQISRVFESCSHKKVWDHFTKAQRKGIEGWKKSLQEVNGFDFEDGENNGGNCSENDMDFSDEDDDNDIQRNSNNMKKRKLIDGNSTDSISKLHSLQEENDSLRSQLLSCKNEIDSIKSDFRSEIHAKDEAIGLLEDKIKQLNCSKNDDDNCDSSTSNNQLNPHTQESSDTINITQLESRLITLISTYLNIHPFGASLDNIWAYAKNIVKNVGVNEVEEVLLKFTKLFRKREEEESSTSSKWLFIAFEDN